MIVVLFVTSGPPSLVLVHPRVRYDMAGGLVCASSKTPTIVSNVDDQAVRRRLIVNQQCCRRFGCVGRYRCMDTVYRIEWGGKSDLSRFQLILKTLARLGVAFVCGRVCVPAASKQRQGNPNKQHKHLWCYPSNTNTTTKYLMYNIIWSSLIVHTYFSYHYDESQQLPRHPAVKSTGHDIFLSCLNFQLLS